MYLSIANHLGQHISEPLYTTLVGPSICQCQWLFLGEPKQSGLALIWVIWYTSTSRKSLNICTWSSAPFNVTEMLSYIIKGPMKVISELFSETWGYLCMDNLISTTRNCHSHIHESTHFILFASLKVHPRCFPLFGRLYFCNEFIKLSQPLTTHPPSQTDLKIKRQLQ
jgi:hypothetical protein